MILGSCECMTCYTYERFLLQGNEIRFDIVIDFNCDNRKALYQDILKNAEIIKVAKSGKIRKIII